MDTKLLIHRTHKFTSWAEATAYGVCGGQCNGKTYSFKVKMRTCRYCSAHQRTNEDGTISTALSLYNKCDLAPRRKTKWDYWFHNLKCGDKVIAIQPWAGRENGYVATIGRQVPNEKGRTVNLRRKDGTRYQSTIYNWYGDCYLHIIPLGHELKYSGKRGAMIVKKKNYYPLFGSKPGEAVTIRFLG